MSSSQPPPTPSVYDSTTLEETIKRTIEGIQKFLNPQHGNTTPEEEKTKAGITTSAATQKHSELQIKTLQDAPRGPDRLRGLLKVKQKEYEKAEDSEDIERLVTEIEMLKFVLFLVNRNFNSS